MSIIITGYIKICIINHDCDISGGLIIKMKNMKINFAHKDPERVFAGQDAPDHTTWITIPEKNDIRTPPKFSFRGATRDFLVDESLYRNDRTAINRIRYLNGEDIKILKGYNYATDKTSYFTTG